MPILLKWVSKARSERRTHDADTHTHTHRYIQIPSHSHLHYHDIFNIDVKKILDYTNEIGSVLTRSGPCAFLLRDYVFFSRAALLFVAHVLH